MLPAKATLDRAVKFPQVPVCRWYPEYPESEPVAFVDGRRSAAEQ